MSVISLRMAGSVPKSQFKNTKAFNIFTTYIYPPQV
jgi:hypothetical protein